jgi:hypothetical protein
MNSEKKLRGPQVPMAYMCSAKAVDVWKYGLEVLENGFGGMEIRTRYGRVGS